jgi:hypothetical protein
LFCFTGNYKNDLSETGRKQTIQRSSTGSTQSADFSKIIKTKSGRVLVPGEDNQKHEKRHGDCALSTV